MQHALDHLKRADPRMAELIERVGPYQIAYREPNFESLVRSIVYQQLSGKAALTIFTRLREALPAVTPDAILALPVERMRQLGLSGQKAAYIRSLAEHTGTGTVDFSRFPHLPDEDVIAALTQVKGVGVWTAHMFLIFALQRPDILPTGDLGVRAGMKKIYRLRELPKPAKMEKIARPWAPYRSVASWYLWRSLDNVGAL